MKRTQIYLDPAQDDNLARRARASGATKSAVIREAIEEYLDRPNEDVRLAELRAVLDELAANPLVLADGAGYVDAMRATDDERQAEIESRRTGR